MEMLMLRARVAQIVPQEMLSSIKTLFFQTNRGRNVDDFVKTGAPLENYSKTLVNAYIQGRSASNGIKKHVIKFKNTAFSNESGAKSGRIRKKGHTARNP